MTSASRMNSYRSTQAEDTAAIFQQAAHGGGRFYNFASYIEQVSDLRAYGGRSLHQQSHGESFISLFANRFEQGIYILDEPEAALSPQQQHSFLKIVHDLGDRRYARRVVELSRRACEVADLSLFVSF